MGVTYEEDGFFLGFLFVVSLGFGQNAWINEIHYDNGEPTGDANEGVEVVIENPGSYTLSNFTVTLYNGDNGESYGSHALSTFTTGNAEGNFTLYSKMISGIQNGTPDGLALDYEGTLIQFLSYEGPFSATNGVANGQSSTDIGVAESSSTTQTQSLQLTGSGTQYSDFTWQANLTQTWGSQNDGGYQGNPLADKKWGIEANLFRLLVSDENLKHSFSGGVSLFNIDRHAEITFQIYYSYSTYFYWCFAKEFNFKEIPLQQLILDSHYRRFLGRTQKGFFISGFIRYANLGGIKEEDVYNYWNNVGEEPKYFTENKIGLGFGIGYRIFSKKGFYWGVSLNIGRYFIGKNNRFYHKWIDSLGLEELIHPTNDIGIIYSFELFKIGWAF